MTGSFDDILQERYQLGSLYSELVTDAWSEPGSQRPDGGVMNPSLVSHSHILTNTRLHFLKLYLSRGNRAVQVPPPLSQVITLEMTEPGLDRCITSLT